MWIFMPEKIYSVGNTEWVHKRRIFDKFNKYLYIFDKGISSTCSSVFCSSVIHSGSSVFFLLFHPSSSYSSSSVASDVSMWCFRHSFHWKCSSHVCCIQRKYSFFFPFRDREILGLERFMVFSFLTKQKEEDSHFFGVLNNIFTIGFWNGQFKLGIKWKINTQRRRNQLNIFNLLYKVSEGLLSFIRSIFVVPGILEIVMDVINRHTIFPIYSRR